MSFTDLTLTTIALSCLAVALPANNALAQERLAFKVGAENAKYTQQHAIDVGDVSGHRVRLFEIHRTYPSKAPEINGMKIVESWSRGISDYTNNNGEAITYGVYVLENGDKFFTRGIQLRCRAPNRAILPSQQSDQLWAVQENSPGSMEWHECRPQPISQRVSTKRRLTSNTGCHSRRHAVWVGFQGLDGKE